MEDKPHLCFISPAAEAIKFRDFIKQKTMKFSQFRKVLALWTICSSTNEWVYVQFFSFILENELRLKREKFLEQKYWEYLEFYMNVLSKSLEFQDRRELNSAIFVFHKVNLQQMYDK